MTNATTEAQTSRTNWLAKLDNQTILTLLLGAGMVYTGFNSSDAVTNRRLDAIEQTLGEIQVSIETRRTVSECQVRTIEKLADRAGVVPPCQM